jgi:hypothetical protein
MSKISKNLIQTLKQIKLNNFSDRELPNLPEYYNNQNNVVAIAIMD